MTSPPVTPRPHEVKHQLHKEIFHPKGERLVGFTKVSKTEPGFLSSTENVHYLCCSVTVKRPSKGFISRFRKPDKGEGYEQRRRWTLEELTKVDGIATSSNCLQFDLHFDRAFKFEAPTTNEKLEFLQSVAGLCSKYVETPPQFVNVPQTIQSSLPACSDVHSQMAKNKKVLSERGEKLNDLGEKTAEMEDSAKNFSKTAHDLANQYKK